MAPDSVLGTIPVPQAPAAAAPGSAPAPADPAIAALSGAVERGGDGARGASTGDPAPGHSSPSQAAPSPDPQRPQAAARRSGAARGRSAGAPAPPPQSEPADAKFTAALAQSLAAQSASAASTKEAQADPGKPPPARSHSEPRHKTSAADPVTSAMALLSQALSAAHLPAAGNASPGAHSGDGSSTEASSLGLKNSASQPVNRLLSAEAHAVGSAAADGSPATGSASNTPAAHSAAAPSGSQAAAALGAASLAAGALPGTHAHGSAPPAGSLAAPVGSNAWNEELGAKVVWMANQGIESASLQVSPRHLGPVQVQISVHAGQASVWFDAASADTRAALERSLPQLRQMFASGGLMLADAGVSREPPRGQERRTAVRAIGATGTVAGRGAASGELSIRTEGPDGLGLIDTYA